eukprot:gene12654-6554_t
MKKKSIFDSCTADEDLAEAIEESCLKQVNCESICIGDENVGKSVFMEMTKNQDTKHPEGTSKVIRKTRSIVADPFEKDFSVHNCVANIRFLDDPGSEEFDHVRSLTYQEGNLFLICFSMVDMETLENVESKWLPLAKKNSPKGFYVIVGLKLDLYNDDEYIKEKELNREEIRKQIEVFKAKNKALPYYEVSSKDRINLESTVFKSVELTIQHLKKKKMLQSFIQK